MGETKEKNEKGAWDIEDRSSWAIGGGVLMGVGAGFFFLKESPLAFVACILIGLGLGLMTTSILSRGKRQR
jgi:hypothetical protein